MAYSEFGNMVVRLYDLLWIYIREPDDPWTYRISTSDLPASNYVRKTGSNLIYLKEISNLVTRDTIFSVDDVIIYLRDIMDKKVTGIVGSRIKHTIGYLEQEGYICYVPNYDLDELLFCNYEYFKYLKQNDKIKSTTIRSIT